MKARVDRGRCVGAGNCVAAAPTAFQLDAQGKATVLDVSSVGEDKLWEAAESCPTDAVTLEDDGGKRIYP